MKQGARNSYANLTAPEKVVWRMLRLELHGPFDVPIYRLALENLCGLLAEGKRRGHFPRSTYRALRDFTYTRREALQILERVAA